MRASHTVMINGRPYDALTGMAFAKQDGSPSQSAAASDATQSSNHSSPTATKGPAARAVHSKPQRSKTLMRSVLEAPVKTKTSLASMQKSIARSPQIKRFSDMAPSRHHVRQAEAAAAAKRQAASQLAAKPVALAHSAQAQPVQSSHAVAPLKGTQLKEALIKEQLRHVAVDPAKQEARTKKQASRRSRLVSIGTGVAALALLAGYLTYLNLPSLSIKVAAAQAGFAATYPSYQPAGYSFNGPVAFSPGEVKVHFKSNTNSYAYTLVQQSSGWDSQAVLDNYVVKQSQEYATLQERGLTIYLYDNKATWVNGGVLYTIDGNAPLSSEQIQKIASSTL